MRRKDARATAILYNYFYTLLHTEQMQTFPALTLSPIGIAHTPYTDRYAAPRQAEAAEQRTEGVIELFAGHNFEQALTDLAGFEKIWVIYWFHRNTTWKPKVLPPRGRVRRGLFATRSPHRPNPIGLSALTLLDVQGRRLTVENPDMLDGTPVLDIKPYIPYADAFPQAHAGWLDSIPTTLYTVEWSNRAVEQHSILLQHGIDLRPVIEPLLRTDPFPHPYRRIEQEGAAYCMACQSWRIVFTIDSTVVHIADIRSGYTREHVANAPDHTLHQQAAHRAWHGLR